MGIEDKLIQLTETKNRIKNAIIKKGGVVNDSTPFGDYAQAIEGISGGGASASPNVKSKIVGSNSTFELIVKRGFGVMPLVVSNDNSSYPMWNMSDGSTDTFWSAERNQSQGEWVIFNTFESFNDTDKITLSTCWNNPWGEYPSTVRTFVISTTEATSIQMGMLDFFNSNYHVIDTYTMDQFTGKNFVDGKLSTETVGELKQILGANTFCIGMLMFCNSGSVKIAECSGIKA